ncbi:MAG: glycoside hydrolase family 3 protein, partial [Fusobacteriaceae bacterium]|nr:glycoside hydrolase family 3 protein [Fusobacteriaceae bacterium]
MKRFNFFVLMLLFCQMAFSAEIVKLTDEASIDKVIKEMTLEEKAKLVCGMGMTSKKVPGAVGSTYEIPRLGIPELVVSDGPAGLRLGGTFSGVKAVYATAFPIPAAMASTWDLDLLNKVGIAMGAESKAFGVDVLLGPAFNIKRDPLNGRNFEYLTEDPYLNGRLAAAIVKGIQSEGVGVSIKHFAVNNQETNRMSINEVVSERALREIYLSAFEYVVKNSDPWTVMSSYPKINGVHGAQNKYLLTDILKNEWKFNGLVMSDWFAVKDAVAAVNAGNDLIMPGGPKWGGQGDTSDDVLAGLKNGTIKEADIDKNIKNILKIVLKSLSFKGDLPTNKPDLKANVEIVRKTAAEGMVLLKNEKTLPIQNNVKLALFGKNASNYVTGGGGSSEVNAAYRVQLLEGLTNENYKVIDSKDGKKFEEGMNSK